MKINTNPISFVKDFLKGYDDVDEVPHPDGNGLVAYKRSDGLFFSLDPNGNLNGNVSPHGWAPSAGAYERFNRRGGAAIHDLSGAAVPVCDNIAGLP